jgi:hypothetical protein
MFLKKSELNFIHNGSSNGKDISATSTNFKSKKQSYCFQAVLASVNIVSQEEIINVPKKANLLHNKRTSYMEEHGHNIQQQQQQSLLVPRKLGT